MHYCLVLRFRGECCPAGMQRALRWGLCRGARWQVVRMFPGDVSLFRKKWAEMRAVRCHHVADALSAVCVKHCFQAGIVCLCEWM